MNWEQSQKAWITKFKEAKDPKGFFSVEGVKGAAMIGEIINKTIPKGLCLDVGCGILPKPSYMKFAPSITFIGIDPYKGGQERKFPFVEGRAENLPFRNNLFNGVLFATSLNHLESPKKGISEAHRVLKRNGILFIWNGMDETDESHLWAFNKESLAKILNGFKLIRTAKVHPEKNEETIIILQK